MLQFTCVDGQFKAINVPEEISIQAWTKQRDTLKDLVEEFKKILLHIAETTATRGGFTNPGSRWSRVTGLGDSGFM